MKNLAKEKDFFGCQNPWESNPCPLKGIIPIYEMTLQIQNIKNGFYGYSSIVKILEY